MRRIALIAILAAGIAGPAAAQQLGPGNPSCYQIKNTLPFQILTHVILPSRARSVARLQANDVQQHCLGGELFPDGQVNFRIVSGLGPPLFSCMTKIDRPIVVSGRQRKDGGWDYIADCR
jgi:hypothetical protein